MSVRSWIANEGGKFLVLVGKSSISFFRSEMNFTTVFLSFSVATKETSEETVKSDFLLIDITIDLHLVTGLM